MKFKIILLFLSLTCGAFGQVFFSDFNNGSMAPFTICTTQSPNYGEVATLNNENCIKFHWAQATYNGTRMTKGAEACDSFLTYKEGWYGFNVYLPSPGYPLDKEAAIAQVFQNGACNSWAALLTVRNNNLVIQHRYYCGTATDTLVASNIPRNVWVPIVLHWISSTSNKGVFQIWFNGAAYGNPTYSKTGINFGFGVWNGDSLAAGNGQPLKFGMYCYDNPNYTAGEVREIYYDKVCQIVGNPSGAFNTVNPTKAVLTKMEKSATKGFQLRFNAETRQMTIQNLVPGATAIIYNSLGIRVRTLVTLKDQKIVHINNLHSGVYFVTVKKADELTMEKLNLLNN